jgi:hypothetical protein
LSGDHSPGGKINAKTGARKQLGWLLSDIVDKKIGQN